MTTWDYIKAWARQAWETVMPGSARSRKPQAVDERRYGMDLHQNQAIVTGIRYEPSRGRVECTLSMSDNGDAVIALSKFLQEHANTDLGFSIGIFDVLAERATK